MGAKATGVLEFKIAMNTFKSYLEINRAHRNR